MLQRAEMFAGSAPIYSSDQDISVSVNVIFLIADVWLENVYIKYKDEILKALIQL